MSEKYLPDGRIVEFVQELNDGRFLVRPEYQDDETGELWYSETIIVDKVFDNPPLQQYHTKIEELTNQVAELMEKIQSKRSELQKVTEEHNALMRNDGVREAMERVADFLEGNFTHFATTDPWDLKVVPAKEAVDQKDRYDRDLKLLTLFGRTNGDLAWKLNRYSDGSGSDRTIVPCKSEEEAQSVVADAIIKITKERLEKNKDFVPDSRHLETAKQYGAEVPEEWWDMVKKKEEEVLRHKLKKAQKDAEEAEKKYLDFYKKNWGSENAKKTTD